MFIRILIFLLPCFIVFSLSAKTLSTISYKGQNGPVSIKITLKEFTKTYNLLKKLAPNTPPAKQFFQEYLRYRLGLEHAYNDKSLVKHSSIRKMFTNSELKEGFEQLLYKTLAEKKLKKKIIKIEQQADFLPKKLLQKSYNKNPAFNIHFITISFPTPPKSSQLKEASSRAHKIYRKVKKSKKPFLQLIDLYSDNRRSGKINFSRYRQNIYPTIYTQLLKMKNGQISKPIKASDGYYIVKLVKRVPFNKGNEKQMRATHFDKKRSQALIHYFNSLKSIYKIKTNTSLLNTLR